MHENGVSSYQKLAFEMIKYTPASQRNLSLFSTPFERELSPDNRWVRMADLVPWDDMAQVFIDSLSRQEGRPTVDLRIVLGALLVKHIENLSDERVIEYIQENIYAQYFVGLSSFQQAPVFVPSLFVEIRKRLGEQGARRLNDLLIAQAHSLQLIKHRRKPSDGYNKQAGGDDNDPPTGVQDADNESTNPEDGPKQVAPQAQRNRGNLIVDATVAPSHIAYPLDSRLLDTCRQISEELIDSVYGAHGHLWSTKPRTYRRQAKNKYLNFSKRRRKTKKDIRRIVKAQLSYVRRNLKTLDVMLDLLTAQGLSWPLSFKRSRLLWIIREVYRQQDYMYRDNRRRVDDRIVSIHQPHLRPIKRGKGGTKNTEFGAKINASLTEGFLRADQIGFGAFAEAQGLQEQIEGYKCRYGYYPATVLADQIYWTRENRNYLKARGITSGGVPLGPKRQRSKYEKERDRKRNNKRSEVEGKFGESKNRYGLDRMYTRLVDTTKAEISLILLGMNAVRMLRAFIPLIWLVFSFIFGLITRSYHLMSQVRGINSLGKRTLISLIEPQRPESVFVGRTF